MLAVCVASGALVGQYWGCSLLETLPEGPSNEALLLITVMHVVNTNVWRQSGRVSRRRNIHSRTLGAATVSRQRHESPTGRHFLGAELRRAVLWDESGHQ